MFSVLKKLIYFHEGSRAGNIYVPHEIDFDKVVFGYLNKNKDNPIAAIGRPLIRGDALYIQIQPMDNDYGIMFMEALAVDYPLAPIGTGKVDQDGTVRDYVLQGFYLTEKNIWHENLHTQNESSTRNTGDGEHPDNKDGLDGGLPRDKGIRGVRKKRVQPPRRGRNKEDI